MAEETVEALPLGEGKAATRIRKVAYEAFRDAILAVLDESPEGVLFRDLPRRVEPRVPPELLGAKGSCSWYTTTVKLDLEARGVIARVRGESPQRLRRVGAA